MESGRSEDLEALSKRSLGREEELTDLEEQHSKLRTLRIRGWVGGGVRE